MNFLGFGAVYVDCYRSGIASHRFTSTYVIGTAPWDKPRNGADNLLRETNYHRNVTMNQLRQTGNYRENTIENLLCQTENFLRETEYHNNVTENLLRQTINCLRETEYDSNVSDNLLRKTCYHNKSKNCVNDFQSIHQTNHIFRGSTVDND